MSHMSFATPLVLTLTIITAGTPTLAQTRAATPNPMGPPVPGICLFARDAALGSSKAGVAANARMRELSQQVQAELAPERRTITTEDTVLKTDGARMSPAYRQQRIDALQKRAAAFVELERVRSAQIQQTRRFATVEILKPMNAALTPIATSRHCSVIFERSTSYGFNTAMDLTPAVVQQTDAHLPTLTFNLAPPAAAQRR
jgi:Skp family chaperone for outer membrane proteins